MYEVKTGTKAISTMCTDIKGLWASYLGDEFTQGCQDSTAITYRTPLFALQVVADAPTYLHSF